MSPREYWIKSGWMITLVIFLYIVAVKFGFFWLFDWYDTMMHLLGGMAIGYAALAIVAARQNASRFAGLTLAVSLAAIIGVIWEIFERIGNQIIPSLLAYGGPRDTVMDVAYAIIGAVIVVLITRPIIKK